MNNETPAHRNTDERVSIVPSLYLGALCALVLLGTFWTVSGDVFDGRHLAGFLLGLLASTVLVIQFTERLGDYIWSRLARRGRHRG